MTDFVVNRRSNAIWVKRQKRKRSPSRLSNHSRAGSACECRPHMSASQTFVSGKFNEFIQFFAGEPDFGTIRFDKRESDAAARGQIGLQEYQFGALCDEFAHRASL